MMKPTTIVPESVSEYREFVQLRLRNRVLEAIEIVIEEELDQCGCGRKTRTCLSQTLWSNKEAQKVAGRRGHFTWHARDSRTGEARRVGT